MSSSEDFDIWTAVDSVCPSILNESYVVVVGQKGSGKTRLIQTINSQYNVENQSTVALDYTFSSASSVFSGTDNYKRSTAHIWELGGSTIEMSDLLQIPFTPQRLPSNVLIFAFDLSKPADLADAIIAWLTVVRKRVDDCTSKLVSSRDRSEKSGQSFLSLLSLIEQQKNRIIHGMSSWRCDSEREASSLADQEKNGVLYTSHPNWNAITTNSNDSAATLLPFPCIIVGTHFDLLRQYEPQVRRIAIALLRFAAILTGSSLVTTSVNDRSSLTMLKFLLSSIIFDTQSKLPEPFIDESASRFSVMPAGSDTIQSIVNGGLPEFLPPGFVNSAFSAFASKYQSPLPVELNSLLSGSVEDRIRSIGNLMDSLLKKGEIAKEYQSRLREYVSNGFTFIKSYNYVVLDDVANNKYPEPAVDAIRLLKGEELNALLAEAKEKERKILREKIKI